ncbi:hypothetical protein BRC90_03745 [Halobacteriales archaeon QS_4_69_34]|nr:MAG: hypothetical protein BRC90_03745 [Halobacteriales archaeon QS_4_69_34]
MPDLSMGGYLLGPVRGSRAYGLSHASPFPVAVLAVGLRWGPACDGRPRPARTRRFRPRAR